MNVDAILGRLKKADSAVVFHDSVAIELRNYASHEGVKDMEEEERTRALERIAQIATRVSGKRGAAEVGAGDVRIAIMYLCGESMTDCRRAAQQVLEMETELDPDSITLMATALETFQAGIVPRRGMLRTEVDPGPAPYVREATKYLKAGE